MKVKLCPILQNVRDEVRGPIRTKQATTKQMNAFNKLVQKIAHEVGGNPTDTDLRRLREKNLLALSANPDEEAVAERIIRTLFARKRKSF